MKGSIDERLHRFLFRYRLTPQSTTGLSPSAELLMGRIRKLKCSLNQVYPGISNKVFESQEKMVAYGTKVKPQDSRLFKVGDRVFIRMFRGHEKWVPAEIVRIVGKLTYEVRDRNGRISVRLRVLHASSEEPGNDDWITFSINNRHNQPEQQPVRQQPVRR